jgi:hypothetical protein
MKLTFTHAMLTFGYQTPAADLFRGFEKRDFKER